MKYANTTEKIASAQCRENGRLRAQHATNGSTVKGDSEEDDSDRSEDRAGDVDAPPTETAGPGDAAPGPSDEREEEKAAEAACEPAVPPPNDMVLQAVLGGQFSAMKKKSRSCAQAVHVIRLRFVYDMFGSVRFRV